MADRESLRVIVRAFVDGAVHLNSGFLERWLGGSKVSYWVLVMHESICKCDASDCRLHFELFKAGVIYPLELLEHCNKIFGRSFHGILLTGWLRVFDARALV